MRKQLLGFLFTLLVVGQVTCSQYKMHLTLETALAYDATQLTADGCATEETFDATITALKEWKEIMDNPDIIQSDLNILTQVKDLIVAAKEDIAKAEATEQASDDSSDASTDAAAALVQLGQSKVRVHQVFTDKLSYIIKQYSLLQSGDQEDLQADADEIITAIDALDTELTDLQSQSADFTGHSGTLDVKIQDVKDQRATCYDTDIKVVKGTGKFPRSATLDDVQHALPSDSSSDSGSQIQSAPQDASASQFIAQSGNLEFVQNKDSKKKFLQRQDDVRKSRKIHSNKQTIKHQKSKIIRQ